MKIRLTGYTFSAAAKTVLHTSFSDVTLAGIQLIVNVTDQIIIYNFADTTKGGTLATDTLTLEYDTTTMSDTDELMILVEDAVTTQPVSGTFYQATQPVSAASLPLPTDAATQTTLALIKAKTDNIPALGQALAAASVPIVLTAAQETALTPPAAITGFATSAKQDTLLTELQLKADLTETQPVSLASVPSHAVTNAGTFAVQGTAVGTIADDATTPGAPVMIGGKAVETDGTDPTSVSAEDDVAILRTDRNRRLLVNDAHPNLWSVSAGYASAQTNASVKAAPGAGLSLYITDISISNGAVAGNITLLDGSGGTVKYEIYPAINGGAVHALRTPLRLTANTALCITSTTVTTHSLNISGFIAP